MNNNQNINIKDYKYNLPDNRIPRYPTIKRDESKLLIYKDSISEDVFYNLDKYLPKESLLIFNNTKVIHARLHFQKTTGADIEIFCLEPYSPHEYAINLAQKTEVEWYCMIGNAKKWKEGTLEKTITINNNDVILKATKTEPGRVKFSWDKNYSFAEILHYTGAIPIPPYLKRESEENDSDRYQTIYSKTEGSVAAPTAGLHFTYNVFNKLKSKNIDKDFITLHVGAGTFKPVKNENISDHEMHTEHFEVSINLLQKIKDQNKMVIPVGTTSVRTLETLYFLGSRYISENTSPELKLNQWDAYKDTYNKASVKEAIEALILFLKKNNKSVLKSATQIMIVPGYKFKLTKALVTNFHQPGSTLLLLIAALTGKKWEDIYDYALNNNFRFLSYGDSSILFPKKL